MVQCAILCRYFWRVVILHRIFVVFVVLCSPCLYAIAMGELSGTTSGRCSSGGRPIAKLDSIRRLLFAGSCMMRFVPGDS